MSNVAVRVENLSKQYKIGTRINRHDTLRDHLMHGIKSLFRRNGHPSILNPQLSTLNPQLAESHIWALKDVSFEVKHGDVVGFIGKNGAGKSTLFKILSRITEPTSGNVKIYGHVGSLLEIGTGFHPELTGRENVYLNGAVLGLKKSDINRKFDEIVAFAEVEKFIDTPVKRYSSGMYVRLAFAVAAHLEPEILIVDEVLAVGDAAFQQKCLGKMSDVSTEGRTVLFVSHDIASIRRLCTRGLVLNEGHNICYDSIEQAIEQYDELVLGRKKRKSAPSAPHIIYEAVNENTGAEFEIMKLEILDSEGNPKDQVHTWDSFIMRIHYKTVTHVNRGAAEIRISSRDGTPLLNLSTQPDSAIPMAIEIGSYVVDCCIQNVPLAAGEYVVSGGLTIPNEKWLWELEALGYLTIHPRDVFNSAMPPTSSRALLAVSHRWVLGRKKRKSAPSAPHIIYEAVNENTGAEFEIMKLEILDPEGNPKDQVYTWDPFVMRVHYEAFTCVDRGAVEIRIASRDNTPVLNLSTQPDSAIPMVIEVGRHVVDCCIQNVPLSAGEYLVSAALTIPNEKWLLELETLGHLTIHPRDVFNSAMPPASSRTLLAVQHHWVLGPRKQKSVPSAPHIIYEVNAKAGAEFEITKLEILDSEGHPKDQVSTWDSFIMRVHYEAFTCVNGGAVEIRIASRDSTRLLNLSTQPDSAIPMVIEVGSHVVDCCIQNVPLSAGEYLVSAALTIPNEKWLVELEILGHLTIQPCDVFNSTMPPASSRALLAVPHHWRIL